MRDQASVVDNVLMRLQTNRQCGWALGKHSAEPILVLLAVMLQLPIVHWPKRQRQPRRLAEDLLVSAKQLRASQSINELLIRI